jgi:hypothetical protein
MEWPLQEFEGWGIKSQAVLLEQNNLESRPMLEWGCLYVFV